MTPEDVRPFLAHLVRMAAYFKSTLTTSDQSLYFDRLQEFPLEVVLTALDRAVNDLTFMPKIAELRRLIVGDGDTATERAWLQWKVAAFKQGAYVSPTFEDGALAATLLAVFGSWSEACLANLSAEMGVAKRREFDRVYHVHLERGTKGPVTLVGICEQTNQTAGYDTTLPAGSEVERLAGPLRRRIAASDEQRAAWRANVARALEGHADVPTPGPEPLATIAPRALKKEPPT